MSRPRVFPVLPVLREGSFPVPAPHPAASEDPDRRLKCARYDECLAFADASRWDSFACTSCDVDDPISHDANRSDVEGMAGLILEVFRGRYLAW